MINKIQRIEFDDFYMRIFDIPDADAVQKLLAKNRDNMIPWVPWAVDEPESVDIKRKKIRQWHAAFLLDEKYTYGLFNKKDHHLFGIQYLFTRQGPGILEIGYIIDMDHSNKAYGTRSSYALTKLGFVELKAEKMMIICSPLNLASAKIPEKLNYFEEYQETTVDRYENGDRIVMSHWAQFPEQFDKIEKYEPLRFIMDKGWETKE